MFLKSGTVDTVRITGELERNENPGAGRRRRHLGDLVRYRRSELQLTQDAAAELAQVSVPTWRKLETGEPVRPLTMAAVEAALGWREGSMLDYLNGEADRDIGGEWFEDREPRTRPIGKAAETDRARSVTTSDGGTLRELSRTSTGGAHADLGGLTAGARPASARAQAVSGQLHGTLPAITAHGAATAPPARVSGQGTVTSVEQQVLAAAADFHWTLQGLLGTDAANLPHVAETFEALEGLIPALRRQLTHVIEAEPVDLRFSAQTPDVKRGEEPDDQPE